MARGQRIARARNMGEHHVENGAIGELGSR